LVSTNATEYLSGPPDFNPSKGTLDYKVAAPHYLPDGSEFLGTYNLNIRSSVARCIYGFNEAPIKASIEILSTNGTQQVAATSIREENGWLYLSASGFTFSNPTISVKLTQENVPAPIQTSNSLPKTPITSEVKKKSILCYKGVIKKRVVAINPTCPKGYSRK
jgi:hypothetical protein